MTGVLSILVENVVVFDEISALLVAVTFNVSVKEYGELNVNSPVEVLRERPGELDNPLELTYDHVRGFALGMMFVILNV